MVNFLVVTHGEFGAYLVEAAESIVGRQQGVRAIAVSPRHGIAEIKDRVKNAVSELRGPNELVILVDMPGGTPSNVSYPLIKDMPEAEMVSGVNLYMVISAFKHRGEMEAKALAERIAEDGRRSMRNLREMVLSKGR